MLHLEQSKILPTCVHVTMEWLNRFDMFAFSGAFSAVSPAFPEQNKMKFIDMQLDGIILLLR